MLEHTLDDSKRENVILKEENAKLASSIGLRGTLTGLSASVNSERNPNSMSPQAALARAERAEQALADAYRQIKQLQVAAKEVDYSSRDPNKRIGQPSLDELAYVSRELELLDPFSSILGELFMIRLP
ncbi:unnamed protein product [Protopolystoma xenopodis]|uniref:Uncharacterized protein n=1 Tax=Protopolystoma xenopodis TaxID=117903 RepID=A0A3S5APH8_9PLAT|nr:unnamed protein product [Protopolystoma xenopodis]